MLTQWGPKVLAKDITFVDNVANLNQNFNLLFLDQPAKTGFSPSDVEVQLNQDAATDVFEFLKAFKAANFGGQTFANRDLHLAGESYAGHYIPYIARRIASAPAAERDPLRLRSVMIGNGWIDQTIQQPAMYDMICNVALAPKKEWMLTSTQCDDWRAQLNGACVGAIQYCLEDRRNCRPQTASCGAVGGAQYWRVSSFPILATMTCSLARFRRVSSY